MVPKVGLEPTRCFQRQILSLVRLPFRHSGTQRTIVRKSKAKGVLHLYGVMQTLVSQWVHVVKLSV